MSTPDDHLDRIANQAVASALAGWKALVNLAVRLNEDQIESASQTLAKQMRQTPDTVKRKLNAIRYAHSLGHSADEIAAYGQEPVLSRFIKKKNADKYTELVWMKWQLPGSLRELVRQDMNDIMWILGLKTSEQLWDFIHSILLDLKNNPEELKHLAGAFDKDKLAQAPSQTQR